VSQITRWLMNGLWIIWKTGFAILIQSLPSHVFREKTSGMNRSQKQYVPAKKWDQETKVLMPLFALVMKNTKIDLIHL